ncbi:CtsR family transcriptional regulator [Chungangia koreensis]|uniref:Transcriptional regulator CtsR n=1 Tax=Chungangia koreensis TaxID=752657 RepID=A0ABV8X7F4_9LACT
MRNTSDIIESYLKQILEDEQTGYIEIKRSEIAERFQCVPSQINYVINTRFTADRGYLVESKRGGGGYIRILRVRPHSKIDLLDHIMDSLRQGASQNAAEDIVYRLISEDVITKREAKLMLSAVDRSTILTNLPQRDQIRGRILHAMLLALKYQEMS